MVKRKKTAKHNTGPKTATEAARLASDDVSHAIFEAELSGFPTRAYDVRIMRERERREADTTKSTSGKPKKGK